MLADNPLSLAKEAVGVEEDPSEYWTMPTAWQKKASYTGKAHSSDTECLEYMQKVPGRLKEKVF